MARCKYCDRSFGSDQALIAHMGHCPKKKQKDGEPAPVMEQAQNGGPAPGTGQAQVSPNAAGGSAPASTAVAGEVEAPRLDDRPFDFAQGRPVTSLLEQIRNLLARGYTAKELIAPPWEFPSSSVYEQTAKMAPPEKESSGDPLPATYKHTEIVSPEAVLRTYMNGSYEDQLELRGMMKLRAAMLMVMELANMQRVTAEADAKRFAPILDMLKESRIELDAAAARAKDSNVEIAERAAFDVAQGMKGAFSAELQALRAAIPGQPAETNPMARALFNAMQPYIAQTVGQVFSGIFKGQQPGVLNQAIPPPGGTPAQPDRAATPGNPALWAQPGEEDQWTEA